MNKIVRNGQGNDPQQITEGSRNTTPPANGRGHASPSSQIREVRIQPQQ